MGDDHQRLILHVEDDPTNRALLRAVIGRAKDATVQAARLVEAEDLASARAVLREESVDLVLLDIRLPDGSGLDLARELNDLHPDRPAVVVMSASVLQSERHAAIEAGADAFLSKPYVVADLLGEIAGRLAYRAT